MATEFDSVYDAINEGIIKEGYGELPDVQEDEMVEDQVLPPTDGLPGDVPGAEGEEGSANMDMVGAVLSKLTQDSSWDNALAAYAEENELEAEAVAAEVMAALEAAGIVLASNEPEVDVDVEVAEVPADAPEMEEEMPEQE